MNDRLDRAKSALSTLGAWVASRIDSRDVLAFTGVALIAWGLGLDDSAGRVAAGSGLFYLGVLHPLVAHVALNRRVSDGDS